jgi:hypothetical protein
LVLAVLAVGVFHTLAPDHWVPIALIARQANWSRAETARVAALAGTGHAVSTLAIGVLVWLAGAALAVRFGHIVAETASVALVLFGGWIAIAAWRELRSPDHPPVEHLQTPTAAAAELTQPKWGSRSRGRLSLLLILGSSPMIEGLPAFFAASRFGIGLLLTMSIVFAAATIVTYIVVCDQSAQALQRYSFGPLERYSEVISGAIIVAVGIVSFFWL